MILRKAVEKARRLGKQVKEIPDFTGNVEEFEEFSFPWLFHIYRCTCCTMAFAVEQEFEDQSFITCPNCKTDKNVRDAGAGQMYRRI